MQRILKTSFCIRTTLTRKNGTRRVVETTYVWDGGDKVVLSGHPGKRDWVASMARNPEVILHTVESKPWFDVEATARVIRDLDDKIPRLVRFVTHWSRRSPVAWLGFQVAFLALRVNRGVGLPWWGPFGWAKGIFQGMPCVELTLTGRPVCRTSGGPPAMSEPGRAPVQD